MADEEHRRRRQFTQEFKHDAVDLVRSTGRPIAQVAHELGIYDSTLGNWVRQNRVDRGEAEGLTSDERARLRHLDAVSRYRCVDAQKAAGFPVTAACAAAGVSVSAYYAFTARRAPAAAAKQLEAELVSEIRAIHADSRGTYGSPRVHAELRQRGQAVNRKRVERLMRTHRIVGHRPRRRRGLTRPDAAAAHAPDLVGRLFDPTRPDMAWCGDVTYIPTDEGWLYLASVIDLASRHLLGWSMGAHHDAGLVTGALDAAVAVRGRVRAAGAAAFHGPHRLVLGQRRRRKLVRLAQGRAGRPRPLPHPGGGTRRDLRLDPPLQPPAAALHHRLPATCRVGTPLRPCPPATIDRSRIAPVSASRGEVQGAVRCASQRVTPTVTSQDGTCGHGWTMSRISRIRPCCCCCSMCAMRGGCRGRSGAVGRHAWPPSLSTAERGWSARPAPARRLTRAGSAVRWRRSCEDYTTTHATWTSARRWSSCRWRNWCGRWSRSWRDARAPTARFRSG